MMRSKMLGARVGWRLLLLPVGLLLLPVSVKAAENCPAQLAGEIAPIMGAPQFRRSQWGILVQTLATGSPPVTLYAQNSAQYFTPASNVKLLTTAAALTRLSPQFRIRTSVYQVGSSSGVVLRVVGRGDPSLTDAELRQLTTQIRSRGISEIAQLSLDDQHFRGDAVNPTWEWEDIQSGYGAAANSLILNQNAIGLTLVPQRLGQPLQVVWDDPTAGQHWQISNRSKTVAADELEFLQVGRDFSQPVLQIAGQLRVGSASESVAISVTQPAEYFGDRFRQILEAEGVSVKQVSIAADSLPIQAAEIAAIDSAPLSKLLIETNQQSNNLYAEALLRSLGVAYLPKSPSLEAGLEELKTVLTRLGVHPEGYRLADGSGLSRRNQVSPAALVETLQAMAEDTAYRNSLSVAGISGTLRYRFQDSPAQGRLYGKTGFISGAAALSGYVEPPNHSPLAVSILVNQFDQPLDKVQQAIDEIVETLIKLHHC